MVYSEPTPEWRVEAFNQFDGRRHWLVTPPRNPAGPRQFATRILRFRRDLGLPPIDRDALIETVAQLYEASFQTEEGHPVRLMVAIGGKGHLDRQLNQPEGATPHWRYWPLDAEIPLTADAITKLARATDYRSSAICVVVTKAGSRIWGLVDQQEQMTAGLGWDRDERPRRPGRFQISVDGVAHLTAWSQYQRVAELHGASFKPAELDVLQGGPVQEALMPGFEAHLERVAVSLGLTASERDRYRPTLARMWFGELGRALLRMRSYESGGALLITNDADDRRLNIRYAIGYDRLTEAMHTRAVNEVSLRRAPTASALRATLLEERDDIRRKVDGANRFVTLLTRVDGLVLMGLDLNVRGFGVKIDAPERAPAKRGGFIPTAGNREATSRMMSTIDYAHYGTRHQSMFRYCQSVSGSVGLVLSQDGTARAVTNYRGTVVLWDRMLLFRESRPRAR